MPADPDQTVTIVTSRAIRAGREEEFERWVEGLKNLQLAACAVTDPAIQSEIIL